jgi:hypothetical protein
MIRTQIHTDRQTDRLPVDPSFPTLHGGREKEHVPPPQPPTTQHLRNCSTANANSAMNFMSACVLYHKAPYDREDSEWSCGHGLRLELSCDDTNSIRDHSGIHPTLDTGLVIKEYPGFHVRRLPGLFRESR